MSRIPRPKDAAAAILAEFAAQGILPGQQLTYQQFLHRLPDDLRNGADIDAGIDLLSSQGYVSQVKLKGPVTLTEEGYAALHR